MNEVTVSNTVVLVDQFTRKAVDSITYDALAKHATVITDVRELSNMYYASEFVFFEPAVPTVVTPSVLDEYISMYSIKTHLIYCTEEVADLFDDNVHKECADYRQLEWNLIYAVIHADLAILEPYKKTRADCVKFSELIDNLPVECKEPVDRMFKSYLDLGHAVRTLVVDNAKMRETVTNYQSVGRKTTAAIQELKQLLEEATEENRTYCAMLSESYDVTFRGLYADRPRVLYIKSISHLSGIDNLIAVLYSVITKQYKTSCKVIKLVDSANASSVRYVPNVYVPITDTYNTYDVLNNDFVLCLGAYNVLMDLLMLNRSGLDVLIVHDQRGTMNDAIDSTLVDLKLNEVSGDYALLGEYDNTLTDIDKGAQFVWKFADVVQYSGTRATRLANHPTISAILNYLL